MHKFSLLLLLLTQLCYVTSARAIDGIILSYGAGMNDILIQYKDISGATQQSIGFYWQTDYHFESNILVYSELEVETYYSQIKLVEKR